jgi:hypothetical protein
MWRYAVGSAAEILTERPPDMARATASFGLDVGADDGKVYAFRP